MLMMPAPFFCIPIQNGKMFSIAFFFVGLKMAIRVPRRIHICNCEKMLPSVSIYISNSLEITPGPNPSKNMDIGFSRYFFIEPIYRS